MDGCSVSALANAVDMERTTLVRTLKPLEARNLINDTSESGVRSRKLHLTEEGYKLAAQARPLWLQASSEIEQKIGKDNTDILLQLSNLL